MAQENHFADVRRAADLPDLDKGFRCYETYQRKTKWVIPLFVLEPATDG